MKRGKTGLSFAVVTLALLVAFSFVAISHFLIKTGKENPSVDIDISVSDSNNPTDSNTDNQTESAALETGKTETEEPRPEVEIIGGKDGAFHKEIQLFHAAYDEKGEISVKSAFGDKVVAPGTGNQYDIYVRNMGKVPISYVLEAQSFLTVTIDGKETEIPIEASFSAPNNKYLLGGEDDLEHLAKLDGKKDRAGLSPEHQAKYTLRWNWPFDGDDEFDTLLGNLAARGEDLIVRVAFRVTAVYDPDAVGGTPKTGDYANIGLWVALFVVSVFSLIMLLFLRKRDHDEEDSKTRKEKKQ